MPPADLPALTVLDGAHFPLVEMRAEKAAALSGINAMIADFEALLAYGQPFVVLMPARRENSANDHEAQKRWIVWLKENRQNLARSCRGFVAPLDSAADADSAQVQHKRAAGLQTMLGGIPVHMAADAQQARAVAQQWLHAGA